MIFLLKQIILLCIQVKGKCEFISEGEKYIYDGDFLNGNLNGQGVVYFSNEDRYEGQFVNKMEGQGVFYYKDGEDTKGNSKT